MGKVILLLVNINLVFFISCGNKENFALINNKGLDDYGVNFSLQCESNSEKCARKPGIEIILFDKFTRDSLKAISLNPPDTFLLCCSTYTRFMDTLSMYKGVFDSLRNAQPFGGVKESFVGEATLGVGGVLTQPGVDSIFTVSIGIQPHNTRSLLAFKDTMSLNVFMSKMDTLFRTCCLLVK